MVKACVFILIKGNITFAQKFAVLRHTIVLLSALIFDNRKNVNSSNPILKHVSNKHRILVFIRVQMRRLRKDIPFY